MQFLSKDDYRFSIKIDVLDALTDEDDSIINELSSEAVEEMKSFLNTRYDIEEIFTAEGNDRNKTIVMYCKDIALYHLFSIRNFRGIPENRITRYKKALSWLQDVNEQKINPDGLPTNEKSFVKTGSNEKRINHQQ